MNPLNVIGALALASSFGLWLMDGKPVAEAEAAMPFSTPAASFLAGNAAVSAAEAAFLAEAIDPRSRMIPATAAPAAAPQAASLGPWSGFAPVEPSQSPTAVAFTVPDPTTLAVLAGVGVAVILRRTAAE